MQLSPRVMPSYLLHQKQHDTNLLFALLLEAMSDDGSDDGRFVFLAILESENPKYLGTANIWTFD